MYRFTVFIFPGLLAAGVCAAYLPDLPRYYVDTSYVQPAGSRIFVAAGADFQAALDGALPGDEIILQAGALYQGPFSLPLKAGSEWIIIRSSASDHELPPPGRRIDPSYGHLLPTLISTSEPVIATASGAHHYRFIGVEIRPARPGELSVWQRWIRLMVSMVKGEEHWPGKFPGNLVMLGNGETSVDQLPHHIIFDRCYIHGDTVQGAKRGIALNSGPAAVIDSYFSDFKFIGGDAQAILGWNGPGPYKIINNYVEGSGENIMFGGSIPSIPNMVPSDIEIRLNYFTKPMTWMFGHPSYAGVPWSVKNLLELKNARRVLIDGNIFEHSWPHDQNGFAILFTVRNEDGAAPWAVVEDITFTNNYLRRIGSGINILGLDDNPFPSGKTSRILIKNNLFAEVGGEWGNGRLLQLLASTRDIIFVKNTAYQTGNILFAEGGEHTGFVFTDNIVLHNAGGVIGTDTSPGSDTLRRYFPGAVFKSNIIAGGQRALYPPENHFPLLPYVSETGHDYQQGTVHVNNSLVLAQAGVDFASFCAATDNVPEICQR